MTEDLRIRTALYEWAGRAATGRLTGQRTREELVADLESSPYLKGRLGEDGLSRFLEEATQSQLEKVYTELDAEKAFPVVAAGRLRGVGWVDGKIVGRETPYVVTNGDSSAPTFRQIPYAYFLPATIRHASRAAQERGDPTVLEAYSMLFGWVEWMVHARKIFWTHLTPKPDSLRVLVEAFGVGPEIHDDSPERLVRLAARLPTWYPFRGSASRARALLEDTVDVDLGLTLIDEERHGAYPVKEGIDDEVFSCRSGEWWNRRRSSDSSRHIEREGAGSMRIEGGFLRFQSGQDTGFCLVKDDVVCRTSAQRKFPHYLPRVLPLWASLRVVIELEGEK